MRVKGLLSTLVDLYGHYSRALRDSYLFFCYRKDTDRKETLGKGDIYRAYCQPFSIPLWDVKRKKIVFVLRSLSKETLYPAIVDGRKEAISNLLIANVSKIEAYFADVLKEVFKYYPERLADDYSYKRTIDTKILKLIYQTDDEEILFDVLIENKIEDLMRGTPSRFLAAFSKISGIPTDDEVFKRYLEVKATRDLIVHNRNRINHEYIKKAGIHRRGKVGTEIKIDEAYLEYSIGVMAGCLKFVHLNRENILKVKS